jgi:tagaturonate reductase
MTRRQIDRSLLASGALGVPHTPGAPSFPVNILQIGDGNFLRAFFDWMVDTCNGQGLFKGGVAMCQPLPKGIASLMSGQGNVYTVLLRGIENGQRIELRRAVSCVQATLNPYEDWNRVTAIACDPTLRFVVSNTTEAGIADVEEHYVPGQCPQSFPAKVAALLHARYNTLGNGKEFGLVFLPCELIEANGTNLKRIVLLHARRWHLGADFIDWVEKDNRFLNTLVDRIVPGYPAAEVESLFDALGYTDPLLVAAEPFHLWVIEGPAELSEELPLHKAGLNVVWTNDLQPYRTRKVRILNGPHTACSLGAFCSGLDTVKSMMDDPVVSKFLQKVMFDEIVPFVPLPEAERQSYAQSIVERFGNPFIRHDLISIALNSVSKWKVRVLPTVKDYVAKNGSAPAGLSFSLAALLWFYRGRMQASDYVGKRAAGDYPIRDDPDVIALMAGAWRDQLPGRTAAVVDSLLADSRLWGEDLTRVPGLSAQVAKSLAAIEAGGIIPAMQQVI